MNSGLQPTDPITATTMQYQQQFGQSSQTRYKNYAPHQQSSRSYYPQVSANPQPVAPQQFPQYYNNQYVYPTASGQLQQHSQPQVRHQPMSQYFLPQSMPSQQYFPNNILPQQNYNVIQQQQLNYYYNQQMGGNNGRR